MLNEQDMCQGIVARVYGHATSQAKPADELASTIASDLDKAVGDFFRVRGAARIHPVHGPHQRFAGAIDRHSHGPLAGEGDADDVVDRRSGHIEHLAHALGAGAPPILGILLDAPLGEKKGFDVLASVRHHLAIVSHERDLGAAGAEVDGQYELTPVATGHERLLATAAFRAGKAPATGQADENLRIVGTAKWGVNYPRRIAIRGTLFALPRWANSPIANSPLTSENTPLHTFLGRLR